MFPVHPFSHGALLDLELLSETSLVLTSDVSLSWEETCSYCLEPSSVHVRYHHANRGSRGVSGPLGTSGCY